MPYVCKHLFEDTEHIFFWRALQNWMVEKRVVADSFTPTLQDVMYRITKECLLNNIILLAKLFIHADILNLFPCLLCLKMI